MRLIILAIVFVFLASGPSAEEWNSKHMERINPIVAKFAKELNLNIHVTISSKVALLAHCEHTGGNNFTLAFEYGLLSILDDEELQAIIAHELGHAWIFTHHPYLQTEPLANEVAMSLEMTEYDNLSRLYKKLEKYSGRELSRNLVH
jgi:hypothetical protein